MKRHILVALISTGAMLSSSTQVFAQQNDANPSAALPFMQLNQIYQTKSRYFFPQLPPPPRKPVNWAGDANERAYNMFLQPDWEPFSAPGVTGPQIPVSTDVTRVNKPNDDYESPGGYIRVSPGTFSLCTSSCYGLTDSQKRFVIFALRGSLYSVETYTHLTLHKGRMLVISSRVPVQVNAGGAKVLVASGASAIVETAGDGITRAYCLSADKTAKAAGMTVSMVGGADAVNVQPGQEVGVAANGASVALLEASDGIARRPLVSDANGKLAPEMRMWEFSLAQMADYDLSLGCRKISQGSDYPTTLLKYTYGNILDYSAKQAEFAQLARGPHSVPVKTTANKTKQAMKFEKVASKIGDNQAFKVMSFDKLHYVITDGQSLLNQDKPKVGMPSYELYNGKLLVYAKKPLKVKADNVVTTVEGGAMVLFKNDDNRLKIISLGDMHRRSVRVTAGKNTMRIAPGQELMITEKMPDVVDVYDVHKVGHRGISIRKVDALGHVTVSDVSVGDIVVHEPLVTAFRAYANTPQEKKLSAQMEKTAASLSLVRSKGGLFQMGHPDDESGASRHVASRCNSCLK
ncbi:MAG: YgdI/YgdR family lipoprotein [Candidatus Obscuribacterales bacterium]|nr:YgdI/YgdR family lipoprotein [Candidatus Obscuribacterales bacterium]